MQRLLCPVSWGTSFWGTRYWQGLISDLIEDKKMNGLIKNPQLNQYCLSNLLATHLPANPHRHYFADSLWSDLSNEHVRITEITVFSSLPCTLLKSRVYNKSSLTTAKKRGGSKVLLNESFHFSKTLHVTTSYFCYKCFVCCCPILSRMLLSDYLRKLKPKKGRKREKIK